MSKKLINALDTCLEALEKGETLEAALARFPGLTAELRPMLETSLRTRNLGGFPVSNDVQRQGRSRLLQHSAEILKARRAPRRTWLYNLRPLAMTLMLVIFFLSGTGLVRASSGALPGDNLYPVKRTWEGMRLLFTFTNEGRENLEMEYENERLEEADDLLAEGRTASITFSGYITAQSDVQWMVSGIPISITKQTILPPKPVAVGSVVKVHGLTSGDGTVDAQMIEVVPPGTYIPTPKPEIEQEVEGNVSSQETESSSPSATESGEDSTSKEKPVPEGTQEPESGGEKVPTED
jgi:hypothetical protein